MRTSKVCVEDSMKSSQTFLLHILVKLSVAGFGWQECDDRNECTVDFFHICSADIARRVKWLIHCLGNDLFFWIKQVLTEGEVLL